MFVVVAYVALVAFTAGLIAGMVCYAWAQGALQHPAPPTLPPPCRVGPGQAGRAGRHVRLLDPPDRAA